METRDFAMQEVVMKNLNFQRECGKLCDIRLSIGRQVAWTHSSIMCPMSPFINKQCCNAARLPKLCTYKTFSFNTPLTIRLNKMGNLNCFKCLRTLLNIIYGQNVTIDVLHLPHMYAMCKLFNFNDIAMKIICKKLDSSNPDGNVLKNKLNECHWTPNAKLCEEINKTRKSSCSSIMVLKAKTALKDKCDKIVKRRKIQINKPHLNVSDLKVLSGKMQSCIGCQYKCYKPCDLLDHLRSTGHGDKVCSLCFAKKDSISDLNDHFKLHDNPKPFFCTVCDVRFQTRTLLTAHLPRHSKETPYTCSHCKKGFKWKHGLNSHLITHSNEKKHLCDECGFSTTHAKTLRAHKLTHTGELFRCSHPGCMHTSSRKENMKIHLGTHNKDKPFVCEICGHKFTQNKSLKRHALIHGAGGLLNTCPHCPFKAIRSDNLKAHILRQHTEKPLQLELSDNFTETMVINIESIPIGENLETDLSVLADAASCCTKIQNPTLASILQDSSDLSVLSRNFDNLIANPVREDLIKIEPIDMLVLDDGNEVIIPDNAV